MPSFSILEKSVKCALQQIFLEPLNIFYSESYFPMLLFGVKINKIGPKVHWKADSNLQLEMKSRKLIEIKCLFSARNLTIKEAVSKQIINHLEVRGNSYTLKRSNNYYYQVQWQLNITDNDSCILPSGPFKAAFI